MFAFVHDSSVFTPCSNNPDLQKALKLCFCCSIWAFQELQVYVTSRRSSGPSINETWVCVEEGRWVCLCVDESYQHVVGGSGVWVAIPLKQKTRASSHLRLAFICRDVSCKSPAALSNVWAFVMYHPAFFPHLNYPPPPSNERITHTHQARPSDPHECCSFCYCTETLKDSIRLLEL